MRLHARGQGLQLRRSRVMQGKLKAMDRAMQVQGQLAQAVSADPDLRDKAAAAFRSFVRAYSTHCKSMKAFFHVRQLHLGHVAHSFGLRCVRCWQSGCTCWKPVAVQLTGALCCSTQPTLLGKAAARSAAGRPGQHNKPRARRKGGM